MVKVTVYKDYDQDQPLTIESDTLGEAIRQLRTWIAEHLGENGYDGDTNGLTVWLTDDKRDSVYDPAIVLEYNTDWEVCADGEYFGYCTTDAAIDSFLQGVLQSGEIDPKPTMQEVEKVLFEFGWPSFGWVADLPC